MATASFRAERIKLFLSLIGSAKPVIWLREECFFQYPLYESGNLRFLACPQPCDTKRLGMAAARSAPTPGH
jgi:hypothetical protein